MLFWQAVDAGAMRTFDIMLEAKAKDIALLRLRKELEKQNEVYLNIGDKDTNLVSKNEYSIGTHPP